MREIKFRAFCSFNKKMFYDVGVDNKGRTLLYDNKKGPLEGSFYVPGWEPVDDCVVMQFTGVRDKNGKEIYEGDILGDLKEKYTIGRVDYVGDNFVIWNVKSEINKTPICNSITTFHHEKSHEVIGNIYENPGLDVRNEPNTKETTD